MVEVIDHMELTLDKRFVYYHSEYLYIGVESLSGMSPGNLYKLILQVVAINMKCSQVLYS